MSKQTILFVGNYNRSDYIDLFSESKNDFNFYFLEYSSSREVRNTYFKSYGESVFWKDYHDAFELLEHLKPIKVLFLFIEAYNHVALNIACKLSQIPTFHLEHGLRADYLYNHAHGQQPLPVTLHGLPSKLLKTLTPVIQFRVKLKTRLFLLNSIECFPTEEAHFMKRFMAVRKRYNFLQTAALIKSSKRQADYYIAFSQNILNTHQRYDNLTASDKIFYIGIPYFDRFASVRPAEQVRAVLLIDQPLSEHGLFGWTKEKKLNFLQNLTEICSRYRYKLYIKSHPAQKNTSWMLNQTNVEPIDDGRLFALAPAIPVIIGFYSTLLMPFASFRHTTVITYENHPIGKINVSKSFIDAGVAHPIYDLEELDAILQDPEALHRQQLPHKAKFTEEWMYKFDGRAGERLRDILLRDDL
ncbi:alpha-2,8-polysialyltransferase family protein [Pontibacter sp. E15-1]|uniref:alpha-2,8-polysialyltransferase family protein n=1 Tax=Pontibacter sp. E15-1 TaxID=2919918 RepID=UPI001F4FBE06|nr:alpha-2,8-polysialyltransferase family protein [Pontibacter sp. E15-1]MCJ8165800.1 alpha-2,8-polysialyltransferase family protein [Pontibacter sp. E15-1]